HAHRPDGGLVAGAESAGQAIDGAREESGIARDIEGRGEFALAQVEFGDGHGRNGAGVVRVDDVEEGLGNFGEVVIEAEVDAGGQQGDGFDEALDVRVFTTVGLQLEAGGDLG